ncbi:MAG TPA: carboxypeptidase regulatory-like domain-containing protein [Bryobacteraceae bacterium]|nr:carboxypeptidase regulatory-like domain-containing protein [Bryobacteraceae bacterium]
MRWGLCALIASLAPLSAQGPTTGSIAGLITDPSGAMLPDAKITVASEALLVPQNTVSSKEGTYRFPSLPPGTYTLTVEAVGFQSAKREQIVINSGFNATIDVPMTVAGQVQTVAVTAEAPVIDVENTKTQDVFVASTLKEIPNSRDMWSLIGISPGMIVRSYDVGGSATGTQISYFAYGMTNQQRVQIDGVNMTEANNASSAYSDYGSFAEVNFGTTGNDASMSTPGVSINFVVKSGGNDFHGDMYEDYENPNFQGHNISTYQLDEGAGVGTRIQSYRDSNGDIGGPIKRDKLWFFFSLRDQEIGTTVTGYPANNPGSAPPFTTTLENATYKITYQLNPKNRISTFLNMTRKQQPFRNASNTQYSDAVYNQDLSEWSGNVMWDSTISPNAFLNVMVGDWGYNWTNTPYKGPDGQFDFRRVENSTGDTAGAFDENRYNRRRSQVVPTFSYSANNFLGRPHFFTIGFVSERETYNFEQYSYAGAGLETFASAAGSPDFTTPYSVTIYNTPGITFDYLRHNGAYIQDKVKVSRKLTLNLGVRWDYYSANRPVEKVRPDTIYSAFFYQGQPLPNGYSIPALYPSLSIAGNSGVLHWTHDFSPRLGFAYDIFGNGKTSIKASYGIYYENPSLVLSYAANPLQLTGYTFKWNAAPSAALTAGTQGFTPDQLGAFLSSSGGISNAIAPGIRDPYMADYNAFVEHEIRHDLVLRAGFVYRQLNHDWALVETARTLNLFTKAVSINDPGPTGTLNQPITVWDIPNGTVLPASHQLYESPNGNNSYYRNLDISVTKRMSSNWSMTAGYLGTWSSYPYNGTGVGGPASGAPASATLPTNPNWLQYNEAHTFIDSFKAFGTYTAKYGITFSPVYRFFLGTPESRYLAVTGLNVGSETIPLAPIGSYRQQNVSIFDTRVEKHFNIKDRYQIGLFFDAFNILNSNADQNQDNVTGTKTTTVNGQKLTYQRFLSGTTIIAPRIFRVGAKFTF